MTDIIKVLPAPGMRVEFAKWGSDFGRRVYTCSHAEFAVPADLFTEAPEELLIGAIVDGHPYRSPIEDAELGVAPPGPEAVQEHAPAGEEASPTAEPEPGPAPVEDEDADDAAETWHCDACDRAFATQRGLNKHRRSAHPEEN